MSTDDLQSLHDQLSQLAEICPAVTRLATEAQGLTPEEDGGMLVLLTMLRSSSYMLQTSIVFTMQETGKRLATRIEDTEGYRGLDQ